MNLNDKGEWDQAADHLLHLEAESLVIKKLFF